MFTLLIFEIINGGKIGAKELCSKQDEFYVNKMGEKCANTGDATWYKELNTPIM